MSKEIYISSTPHETRLAIVESDELTEIYYERENEYTLAGSIYNGRVTRVLPGMQSSFVDIGLERDAFLYITDFMEEAADTAEFDHSGDLPKPTRLEAPRGERNGGDGREYGRGQESGERSGAYVSERNQEQASATPASDVARASEGRSEEFGGRGDRGGRGRGRGRRDRGERPASGERGQAGEASPRFEQTPAVPEASASEFEVEERLIAPGVSDGGEDTAEGVELGEGAPGADGSRRWRGRRGRRRGRGTAEGGVRSPEAVADGVQESGDAVGFSIRSDEPVAIEPVIVAPPEPAGRDRQRGRDGVERGGRNQGAPRVPRGFAPRRSLYGVDSEPEVAETSVGDTVPSLAAMAESATAMTEPEPLILPGESLSKYRKDGDTARSGAGAPQSIAAAVPDSGFKVDPNWDGGAMLPGETLSRYRGGASAPQASASPEWSEGRRDGRSGERSRDGRRDERDRNRSGRDGQARGGQARGGRDGRQDRPAAMTVPASVPAADLQSGGPVQGYPQASEQAEELQAHRPDFTHSELPEATAEAVQIEDLGLAHHGAHGSVEQIDAAQGSAKEKQADEEYEPEGQSVSYRVDPAPPSEYRLQGGSAAIEMEEEIFEEEAVASEQEVEIAPSGEVFAPELAESVAPAATKEARVSLTALPAGLRATSFPLASGMEWPLVGPEVTTVDAMGEMHSEAFEAHVAETEPQGFAPGAGDLEEDFIDEEELEIASLQAQSDDEFDDLEEEHLEGTADLGMMIRDMSVDQITRASGASVEEEEDDFEEDTLDEEQGEAGEESEGFAASPTNGFERQVNEETPRTESRSSRGDGSVARNGDREGRGRDNGRRGGRDRNGGRESGNRAGRGDRNGSPETGAYSSERSGPDRSGMGERARNTGGASDRDRGRSAGRGGGRQSAQMTNLPAISDLLKPGQEILCQIAKEPIAKKGARITSHIALPGRFLVFMPTVSHTGVSRKIESDVERRRLKEILLSEKGEAAGGFIVRTAAAGASEEELRSDLRFLLNLWSDIKQRSEASKSPALIYHDLNLVERILRDQVTDNFSAIWVDTETEYERVLRFLQRFQPGLIRRVKLYTKETPLFEQFGITEEINKALRSKVWLKSGGSIVINQTEALVAIDINTGKYVGKTARLEDTIVKTNLDAIPEIVRQIRLRDLGGIIIIDFIDMDERKNRNRVMQALEDELKNDRAPSKVLPFNDFGLVAITRKRVKQSLERTLSTTCGVCAGTGMVKSPVTVCNDIYVEMRKMHKHLDRGDVMLRVHPDVVKQLKSTGTRWLQEMEEMCGKTILIKSDPSLHPEQFDVH